MNKPVYIFDGWRLDVGRRTLTNPNGDHVHLTEFEFEAMVVLCQRPQQTVQRNEFKTERIQFVEGHSIDVRVCRLRRKLQPNGRALIRTIRNVGFYFTAPVTIE